MVFDVGDFWVLSNMTETLCGQFGWQDFGPAVEKNEGEKRANLFIGFQDPSSSSVRNEIQDLSTLP